MVAEDGEDVNVLCAMLLQSLHNAFGTGTDDESRVGRLNDLLLCRSAQSLFVIYKTLKSLAQSSDGFRCGHSILLVNEVHAYAVSDHHSSSEISTEMNELSDLFLSSPHLLALLHCQDQIIEKDYKPELPELEFDESILQAEDESMKVVRLMKGNEPLGATIALDETTKNIVIARLLKGGAADRSGLIHANDILVEINKTPTHGRSPEEVINQLADYRGPLTLCLIPAESTDLHQSKKEENFYVKSGFDYDPHGDNLIPCTEAGLRFRKNDILHVVSREDNLWWQASIEQSATSSSISLSSATRRAGLIPSERLQRKRQAVTISSTSPISSSGGIREKGSSSSLSAAYRKNAWTVLRQSFRFPRRRGETVHRGSSVNRHPPIAMPIYEEVVSLPPPAHQPRKERRFRPLVLVGPQGIGRNLLKDRLIEADPSHYGVPVPHTSREKLPGDVDGMDYHFVTRDFMENGIRKGMFLEYGEYKGNIYGTSLIAVEDVIANHQVCILTPYPQALKLLRNAELKPFVIFVKPPVIVGLGSKQSSSETKLTIDRNLTTPLTPEEIQDLSERGNRIEAMFGHLFDYTIVNQDVDRAFSELLQVSFSVENEQHWIPKSWAADS